MEAKKSDEANIEKQRGAILGMSFLFVASIVGVAFAFMQATNLSDNKKNDRQASTVNVQEESKEEEPDEPEPEQPEPEQVQATPPPTEESVEIEDTQTEPEATIVMEEPPAEEDEPAEEIVEEEIVDFPDVEAEFPGGVAAMKKWIADNIEYPETSIEMNEQGRVYLEFVVEKDGSISRIKVKRGVSDDIDREAKRILRAMPSWKPGEANGKIVRTTCTIPINFVLN